MLRLLVLPMLLLASPAFAHYGDHSGFDLSALAAHLFEVDHIIFAAIAVMTGIIAYRLGRRAEQRAVSRKERAHDPR